MANKYMKDDVYVIDGITSTDQLEKFYNEVVQRNIEKYCGITTQGRKFGFTPIPGTNHGRAIELKPEEEYAINPDYRDLTLKPIEEVVAEADVEEVVVPVVEKETEADVEVESKEIVNSEKDAEIERLKLLNETLNDELALAKERADVSENDVTELVNQKIELETLNAAKDETILELQKQINELTTTIEDTEIPAVEPLTIDDLLNAFDELGYKVYITRK